MTQKREKSQHSNATKSKNARMVGFLSWNMFFLTNVRLQTTSDAILSIIFQTLPDHRHGLYCTRPISALPLPA